MLEYSILCKFVRKKSIYIQIEFWVFFVSKYGTNVQYSDLQHQNKNFYASLCEKNQALSNLSVGASP